jgi:S-methylmethionine-dependent homocysteine/selenocysteine methylase
MGDYRDRLPQFEDRLFVTDGGLETTLIFHEGMELPSFAAFGLLENDAERAMLRRYFARYAELDESTDLNAGDPKELGEQHRALQKLLPRLAVMGGCCGTDERHVDAICSALATKGQASELNGAASAPSMLTP